METSAAYGAVRPMIVDYHVHSCFSADGRSSIGDLCRSAMRFGLGEIGFAEHVDFDPADPAYGFFDYEAYSSAVEEARRLFGGRIIVRKGVEIDYQSRFEEAIRRLLAERDFDFTIGSVHYVPGKHIDDRRLSDEEAGAFYPAYCGEVTRSMACGLFDIVGHFDLIGSSRQIPSSIKNSSVASVLDTLASAEVSVRGSCRDTGVRPEEAPPPPQDMSGPFHQS